MILIVECDFVDGRRCCVRLFSGRYVSWVAMGNGLDACMGYWEPGKAALLSRYVCWTLWHGVEQLELDTCLCEAFGSGYWVGGHASTVMYIHILTFSIVLLVLSICRLEFVQCSSSEAVQHQMAVVETDGRSTSWE
jgi:hypothetical protein